jgi:signal transduction histidine kinase
VDNAEKRVLSLNPTGRDAELARAVLGRAGVQCTVCADMRGLSRELEAGAAALLIAEEAIDDSGARLLQDALSRQPPWSDLPLLVLARPGADSASVAQAMDCLGNVTVLERPTRVAALVSAVRCALRARQRQYQIREHLAERARAEASQRELNRRKDEFLAILAHELRNPLAPIKNSLHIMRMACASDESTHRITDMLERQVNHMVRLVDDLLEVSRITRGKIELHREPVELAAVVRHAVEISRPLIDAAHHQLAITLPPEPLTLDADAVRLAQVFANLLNNAAKYTPRSGQISVTARPDGAFASVSVRDTGVGIPRDMLTRVFDIFTQVECAPGRSGGGLGIGLTLVKSLVELHGGTVEAHSNGPDRGSEFVVRLPISTKPVGTNSPSGATHGVLPRRRVLVVDDNRDAAESLGLLLGLLGAQVLVVNSGPEALDALPAYRPQVVLLDIGMPDMDGYEVARRIRQKPEFRDLTLIALTGWGQEEDRRRSEEVGFSHHLIKPPDMSVLEELLGSS